MIWKRKNIVDSQAENAYSKVPWSKGQDTGLSSRRYWVQGLRSASVGAKRGPLDHSTPWGSLWLLSLKVRTPASQAGNDGFKPHRSYCGYRTMAVRQIVALLTGRKMPGGYLLCADRSGAKTDSPWSPHGWVCLVARAADCKSVTKKHRRFESCPIHFPFACPSGLWCHPAKVVCGNAPKVRILPQTL